MKIKDMVVGQIGFCVPWAFWTTNGSDAYLSAEHSFSIDGKGTMELKIARTNDGFMVDFSLCPDEFVVSPDDMTKTWESVKVISVIL